MLTHSVNYEQFWRSYLSNHFFERNTGYCFAYARAKAVFANRATHAPFRALGVTLIFALKRTPGMYDIYCTLDSLSCLEFLIAVLYMGFSPKILSVVVIYLDENLVSFIVRSYIKDLLNGVLLLVL